MQKINLKKITILACLALNANAMEPLQHASTIDSTKNNEIAQQGPFLNCLNNMVINEPELLPAAMLTCKTWYAATKHLQEVMDFIFIEFKCSSFKYYENTEAFKHIVFNKDFIEIPYSKSITHYITVLNDLLYDRNNSGYFDKRNRNYTNFWAQFNLNPLEALKETMKFSYFSVFKLFKMKEDINISDIETYSEINKDLNNFKNNNNSDHEDKLFSSLKIILTNTEKHSTSNIFSTLCNSLLKCTKLVFIQNKKNTITNKLDRQQLRKYQEIPVNFSTLEQDIQSLQNIIQEQLSNLVQQRWNIEQELKLYSYLG